MNSDDLLCSSDVILDPDQTSKIVLPKIRHSELQIFNLINKGAFGHVYKGKCRGMDVAIKYLDNIEWSDEVVSEFVAEVGIMARLHHPNILICLGACTEVAFGQNYAIVMEYMPRGDLHSILHNSTIQLSLAKKLQFAIDITRGMAWLRFQKILHRDLKPANVLVDINWTCKIADFGLSQIQRSKQKKRDTDEAPGSVLWMAPEVLLKEEIDFKLDVYAFALVFWEILTRKPLFSEYSDRDIFTEDIARRGVRPPLDNIHLVLHQILKQGWHHYPSQRPTFEMLVAMLEKAIIDIYLPETLCPVSHKFWNTNFHGMVYVNWNAFVKKLYPALGKKPDGKQSFLESLICEVHGEKQVSIEQWSMLLKWFGKMQKIDGKDIMDRVEHVMTCPWFFGIETAEKAKTLLLSCAPGTFFIRLNTNPQTIEKSPFTISRVGSSSAPDPILHTRIYVTDNKNGFYITIDNERKIWDGNSSIVAYVDYLMNNEKQLCREVCKGWPFQYLTKQSLIVYQEDADS
eukprot:TRINITY_DN13121_c0_g1_i1.p1 TRINITY_DN13121_c0_g1~~TRINITY_DN13121_c0_g1_i1.p1  ORF type:complete len:529 (-),score=67.18 TRINITY_DN13121_c0_g1_i1:153-1697(-)